MRRSNYHYVDQFSKVKIRSKAECINILNELKALSQKRITNKAVETTLFLRLF